MRDIPTEGFLDESDDAEFTILPAINVDENSQKIKIVSEIQYDKKRQQELKK